MEVYDDQFSYHEWPPRSPVRSRCGALGAAALLGAGTAVAKVGEDAELLELFEE
jgi:hypothetical protein